MDNLDAELKILLSEENPKTKERALSAASSADEAGRLVDVFLVYKNDLQPIRDIGYDLRSFTGNITSGTIPIQQLALVAQHPNVVSIHIDGESYLELNDSLSDIHANLVRTRTGNTWNSPPNSFTGKGVIVGIIDSGIDFFHPTFRNTDAQKTTRILSIWDQTLLMSEEPATGGHLPTHIDGIEDAKLYGVEYDANKIKQALEAANSTAAKTFVRHEDKLGHGTHVAGIAAGNGSQDDGCHGPFYYAGVAPEADLIIIKYGNPTGNDLDTGNNSRVIDAIRYIITRSKAAGKRAVFNMSFGDGTGSRDGKTIYEHTIDMLLAEADSNQIIGVKSAGNRGDSKGHATGVLPASGNLELEFNQIANGGAEKIEIWYNSTNAVSCTIKQPDDKVLGPVTEGDGTKTFPISGSDDTINRGGSVTVSHGVNFDSSAKKILIKLQSKASELNHSGTWLIKLHNDSATPTTIHAWIVNNNSADGVGFTTFSTPDKKTTLTTPGTAQHIFTVGNYQADRSSIPVLGRLIDLISDGDLDSTSSRGPTRDNGFRKPELVAPGVAIKSANINNQDRLTNCCCNCCLSFYVNKSGTSMAAPHVTGAVALLLQKDKTLTREAVRTILTNPNITRHDSKTGATPNDAWGFGKLDVKAALDAVTPIAAPAAPPIAVPLMAHQETYHPLQTLQERFLASPKGGYLLKVGQKHFNEIRNLINANKRVATVWHRCQGPAWLRTGFTILSMPDMVIPEAIANVQLTDAVRKLTDILTRYGSPELVNDLNIYQPDLQILRGGVSVFDLAESFDLVAT